jgi:ankyrin repeat protein
LGALLSKGANVNLAPIHNASDDSRLPPKPSYMTSGMALLDIALRYSLPSAVVNTLIEGGANVTNSDDNGFTPLFTAAGQPRSGKTYTQGFSGGSGYQNAER